MPNGKPGDAPWSDLFVYGREIFPPDMAMMLRAISAVDSSLIRHLAHPDMARWEKGEDLDDGRRQLAEIMKDNNIRLD